MAAVDESAPLPKKSSSGVFSVSFGATVIIVLYVSLAMLNMYKLMFPLAMLDQSKYHFPRDFVHPLWKKEASSSMHMRVYLSTEPRFSMQFLKSQDFHPGGGELSSSASSTATSAPSVLLWDQKLEDPALSMSFLLTSLDEHSGVCETDASYQYAVDWLNRSETARQAEHDGNGGILSALSAASGQGIESTSFLLTLYGSIARRLRSMLEYLSVIDGRSKSDDSSIDDYGFMGRNRVEISQISPIWSAIQSNSTLFVHVLVLRAGTESGIEKWPPATIHEAEQAIRNATSSNSMLMGQVSMIKYDKPNHIGQPKRFLYRDFIYFWNKFVNGSREMPPWLMAIYKPEEYAAFKMVSEWKRKGMGYPYWKPEVSIKYVSDEESYPADYAHMSGMPLVQIRGRNPGGRHPTGYAFTPALHVDEMGMTSEKYIPVNKTVTSLPLRISFDRSDMEHKAATTTATAGGISPARWRLLSHLSDAIEKQKQLGFDESDIDDLKRMIADTNITLLAITLLASALHLLFEFLTFKSEVSFWKKNKDLTGLSVRSLFLDLIGQTVILFYLIEKESSFLTTVPSAIGCFIALWKCQRAAGLQFIKASKRPTGPVAWWNWLPRALSGYELRATRLEARPLVDGKTENQSNSDRAKDRLIAMTIDADRLAASYLGAILLPLAGGYSLYSLFYMEHKSWYSWLITSSASAVYALGFVLMTPQLFLNWKMKSVAHLPWRVLVYKSLNTFIDDLFSFIIRMPTMARISCFRDDVVFFIYLYQRWLYPVDTSRPVEGGGEGERVETEAPSFNETKKDR